jgi:NADP-dependent 3-hydroxy acid dehydrogenase YdfG
MSVAKVATTFGDFPRRPKLLASFATPNQSAETLGEFRHLCQRTRETDPAYSAFGNRSRARSAKDPASPALAGHTSVCVEDGHVKKRDLDSMMTLGRPNSPLPPLMLSPRLDTDTSEVETERHSNTGNHEVVTAVNEHPTSPLAGQVAVITGASSGIGHGLAVELNQAGMSLVLTARRSDRLEALAAELSDCCCVPGDIADAAMPQKLMDTATQRYGRCDVVFNSAGVMHVGSIEDVDTEVMARMIDVNVTAATRLAYTALKHFKSVGSGHLVNVSSVLGTKVRPTTGVYAGTKYAIEALSEALRMEVAKTNVKVSVIEPGVTRTELQDHFPVHPSETLGITQPLEVADVARCVRFVLEQPSHVRIPIMMILPGEQPM